MRRKIDVLEGELEVALKHNTATRRVHGGHGRTEITSNAFVI